MHWIVEQQHYFYLRVVLDPVSLHEVLHEILPLFEADGYLLFFPHLTPPAAVDYGQGYPYPLTVDQLAPVGHPYPENYGCIIKHLHLANQTDRCI